MEGQRDGTRRKWAQWRKANERRGGKEKAGRQGRKEGKKGAFAFSFRASMHACKQASTCSQAKQASKQKKEKDLFFVLFAFPSLSLCPPPLRPAALPPRRTRFASMATRTRHESRGHRRESIAPTVAMRLFESSLVTVAAIPAHGRRSDASSSGPGQNQLRGQGHGQEPSAPDCSPSSSSSSFSASEYRHPGSP